MQLVIKEYLQTLKEKDELDTLLCDLLVLDGYKLYNLPKTGERQYGVDVLAMKGNYVYLFVLKQQNITRSNWDSGPDSVRQSLNEINDVYLETMLPKEWIKNGIEIILASNGYIDAAVQPNWELYKHRDTRFEGTPINYDYWSIDVFVDLCYRKAFNEHLFDKSLQSMLRKVLYFMEENDFSTTYFEKIIDKYIEQINNPNLTKYKLTKNITSFFMCVSLMCQWAINIEKYKISINILEYALIKYWSVLYSNNYFEKSFYINWLHRFFELYEKSNGLFFHVIKNISSMEYAIPSYNSIENRILLFDIIGRLSAYGLYFHQINVSKSQEIVDVIISLLNNNPAYKYPVYDIQILELSLIFILLKICKRDDDLGVILATIVNGIKINYIKNHKYPSPNDSYYEALQIEFNNRGKYKASVLFGGLLEWLCLTKNDVLFNDLKDFINESFPEMTCQAWQVSIVEEENLYYLNAEHIAGIGIPFDTRIDMNSFHSMLNACDTTLQFDEFSFNKYSFPAVSLISSRYFNYPVLPQFWRSLFKSDA